MINDGAHCDLTTKNRRASETTKASLQQPKETICEDTATNTSGRPATSTSFWTKGGMLSCEQTERDLCGSGMAWTGGMEFDVREANRKKKNTVEGRTRGGKSTKLSKQEKVSLF